MEPARQKWTARVLLFCGAVLGLCWLAHLDLPHRVSTDVLDLVPADERSPELSILRNLAGQDEARILLFALKAPAVAGEAPGERARRSEAAAQRFAAALRASPAIAQVVPLSDEKPREALGAAVFAMRLQLLLPGWLEDRHRQFASGGQSAPWSAWLAEQTASDLEHFLSKPEAMAVQDIITADPLMLLPGLVGRVSGLSGSGLGEGAAGDDALVWAKARYSPLASEGQAPVSKAVGAALARARADFPGLEAQWTGIGRFAAASRARIEQEVSTLNVLSLICVVAVAGVCVKRAYRALQLVPVVLGALLGAWVVTTASWQHVHILVFVVGSLLAGVAVDYGFYLYLQPLSRPGEPYMERASRLLRPLLASALTTVIGFSFLLWSELPLIRQLGVFVSAGLICALATALLWFAQLDDSHLETRSFIRRRPSRSGATPRRVARLLLAAGALVAVLGPWRLHWRDDIRELEIPTPELRDNDAAVRARFGQTEGRTVYITRGATIGQARENLETFLAWHDRAFPGVHVATLGYAVPTPSQWASLPARLSELASFTSDLGAALARHGFEPEAFAPFYKAFDAARAQRDPPSYDQLLSQVGGALHGPLESLVHQGAEGTSWFVTIADHPSGEDPPAALATVTDSQLQKLNSLFSRYRISALRLSSVGLGFVGASVFVLYGLRRGVRIFAIPAGACLFAFGLFGLCGVTLNLFNLLGAFLGVCLSHNYAIFSAESEGRGEDPPPSVRMSAAAAASSFGVLALSHIPVVAALGTTVAVIVLAALAITELTPLSSAERMPAPPNRP